MISTRERSLSPDLYHNPSYHKLGTENQIYEMGLDMAILHVMYSICFGFAIIIVLKPNKSWVKGFFSSQHWQFTCLYEVRY